MRGAAHGRLQQAAVRVESRRCGRAEATLEPAPGDVLRVEQVADVPAGHAQRGAVGGGAAGIRAAVIEIAIEVTDVGDHGRAGLITGREGRAARAAAEEQHPAVGLAGDQVERARRRRAVGGVEVVVVHREVLRPVPHRGDGVAVVVAEHRGAVRRTARAGGTAGELREHVHETGVDRLLLGTVAVVLAAGEGLGRRQAHRIGLLGAGGVLVGIVGEQLAPQAVDARRERGGQERRLARIVLRVRIGAEVVIERHVLLEQHHDVADRSARRAPVTVPVLVGLRRAGGECGQRRRHERRGNGSLHGRISLSNSLAGERGRDDTQGL